MSQPGTIEKEGCSSERYLVQALLELLHRLLHRCVTLGRQEEAVVGGPIWQRVWHTQSSDLLRHTPPVQDRIFFSYLTT